MMQLLGKDAAAEKHLRLPIELQPNYAAYTYALGYTARKIASTTPNDDPRDDDNLRGFGRTLLDGLANI
jgi:hypothetical protein